MSIAELSALVWLHQCKSVVSLPIAIFVDISRTQALCNQNLQSIEMIIRVSLGLGLLVLTLLPVCGQEKKPVQASPNFTDHVLPIFREHCLQCHNANDAEAGLAIDSYGALMEGGGSGDAVVSGDASASRLYLVMTHDEEPTMPPNQDPISNEKLDIIKKWIDGGLLENSGSKAKKRKGPSLSFTAMEGGKPSEIVMPESLWRVPVVVSGRAAASSALAASPWAPLVAVAGQKQVSLYHTETGKLEGIIPFPEGIPQVLTFSVDGGYLLVAGGAHSANGVASVYNIKTGERVIKVGNELDTVFGADVNDDLSKIALGGPQKLVRIFDTASGESLFDLKKHTDWVYTVDFSPDGVLVASGDRSGGLHVWEADTGRLYLDLVGHKAAVRGLSWRADSNVLVSASEDGTVKLWEMNNGKQLKSFSAHGGGATGVVMARDGRMVTSGKDNTVKLWNADGGAIATMPAFAEPALEAVITHDGSRVIGGDWSGRTVMWEVADTKKSVELASNPPPLEEYKTTVAEKVAKLNTTVAAAVASEAVQQKQVEAGKTAHAGVTVKLSETKAALAKANADKAASDRAMAEMQTQKTAMGKSLASANVSMAALKKQVDDAQASIKTQETLVAQAVARRDKANAEKAVIDGQIANVNQRHEQLKVAAVASFSQLMSREVEIAAMKQAAMNAEVAAETERKAAETAIAQLNAAAAEFGKTLLTLKSQDTVATEQQKKASEAASTAAEKVVVAGGTVEAATAAVAMAKEQLNVAKEEAEKKIAADLVAKREGELKNANTLKLEAEKLVAAQKALIENATKTIADVKAKMANVATQQTALNGKIEPVKKQMATHLIARDDAKKQTAMYGARLAQVAGDLTAAKKAKDEAVQKMAVLVKEQTKLTVQQQASVAITTREEAAKKSSENKIVDTTVVFKAAKLKLDASGVQVGQMTANLTAVVANLKIQAAAIAKHIAAIKQLTVAIPALEKQLVAAKKTMDEAVAGLVPMQAATGVAHEALAVQTTILEGIESELVAFKQQSEKIAAELEATAAAAAAKRKALEPIQASVTNATNTVSAREAQIKQMAEAMAKLQAELAALNKAQTVEQSKLDETRSKLEELETAAEAAEDAAQETKDKAEFFRSVYGA